MGFFENTKISLEDFFKPKSNGIKKAMISREGTEEGFYTAIKSFIRSKGGGSDTGMLLFNIKRGEIFFEGKIYKYDRQIPIE